MRALYHIPSGTTPLSGFLLAVLAGSLIAAVPAALYAYMVASTGIVLLTLLASIVFGVLTGWLATWVLRQARVRRFDLAMAGTFVIASAALYANRVVWIFMILEQSGESVSASRLLFDPGLLWQNMLEINAVGTWEMDDHVVRRGWLWAAWTAEAMVVIGLAMNYARHRFTDTPYCEECGNWCAAERRFMQTTNCKVDVMKQKMEARDFEFLQTLGPRRTNDNFYYSFDLYTCPGCGTTNTLSVDDVTLEQSYRDDREFPKSERIIHNLPVDTGEVARLRAIAEQTQRGT